MTRPTKDPDPRERLHKRWERLTEWPMIAIAVVFLAVYSAEVLTDSGEEGGHEAVLDCCWALFAVDFAVRLATAPRRWHWLRHNMLDFASVALPALRPLRLVRILAAFRVFQRRAETTFRGRLVLYTGGLSVLLVWMGALAVLQAERHAPGALITDVGRALWWSLVTVTTVGYGDISPVTPTGRVVATGFMLFGIALLGVVTGLFSSWIVERVRDDAEQAARGPGRAPGGVLGGAQAGAGGALLGRGADDRAQAGAGGASWGRRAEGRAQAGAGGADGSGGVGAAACGGAGGSLGCPDDGAGSPGDEGAAAEGGGAAGPGAASADGGAGVVGDGVGPDTAALAREVAQLRRAVARLTLHVQRLDGSAGRSDGPPAPGPSDRPQDGAEEGSGEWGGGPVTLGASTDAD